MRHLWTKYLKSNAMQFTTTKVLVLFILLFIVILVRVMFFSYQQSTSIKKAHNAAQKTQDVIYNTEKLLSLTYNYERCITATNLADAKDLQQEIGVLNKGIQTQIITLKKLMTESQLQRQNFVTLTAIITKRLVGSDTLAYLANKQLFKNANAAFFAYSNNYLVNVKQLIDAIQDEEAQLLTTNKAENENAFTTLNVIFYVLGFVILLLVVAIVRNVQQSVWERKTTSLLQEYSTLIDLSNDAIVTTDAASNILQWSKGAESLYGYSKQEVIGKKITNFTNPIISTEDLAEIHKTIDETGSWRGEMTQLNKEGKELYLDVSYSKILNKNGTTKGYSSIRSNITELKKSKINLQQLNTDLELEIIKKTREIKEVFERMQKAFLAFDANWVCTYANQPILYYLTAMHDEIIGKNFNSFFDGITDTNFYKACLKAMETQEVQELCEYVPFFNCWFESSIYPSVNGVSIYLSDITDKKKIEHELVAQKRQLRNLSNHIQNLREAERKIIARELHDDLGQIATVLKIDIRLLKNSLVNSSDKVLEKVNITLTTVDELIKRIREISHELRPTLLDNVGLQAALKSHCLEFERKTGINCFFYNETDNERLPQDVEIALFRICQESLTNVMRHAEATEVIVKLSSDNKHILLQVSDNGNGFDMENISNTLGLVGIKERAESIKINLTIESALGNGTIITASGIINENILLSQNIRTL